MHIGRWFCSSCLASGTLGDDPNLRKVCTDIDKEWKICTDIMYRNLDADLRKVCTKILCKVQGATQGEVIQPHPSLPWPVASGWKQLIRLLLAFWSFAGFVHTATRGYMRIQLYGMSQWLQTELVARLLNHLEHFPQSTYDTHTNTKTGTPGCLLTSNKLTIQSLVKFYGTCCQE